MCRCGKRYWKGIMELAVAVRMRRREEQIRSSRCIQLVTIRHRFNSLFWRTHKKLLPVRFHQLVTICNLLQCGCLEIPNNHFSACSFFIEFAAFFVKKRSKLWVSKEGKGARVEVRWMLGREENGKEWKRIGGIEKS